MVAATVARADTSLPPTTPVYLLPAPSPTASPAQEHSASTASPIILSIMPRINATLYATEISSVSPASPLTSVEHAIPPTPPTVLVNVSSPIVPPSSPIVSNAPQNTTAPSATAPTLS